MEQIFPADIFAHSNYRGNADRASVKIKLIILKIIASNIDGSIEFVKKTIEITGKELCLKVQLLCDS